MTHAELFRQIEDLVPTLGGWSIPEKCCEFAAIVVAFRPRVTVELGTWMGRGAFSLAMAHRFVGCGKVHVVDPWSGAASAVGMDGQNAEWWEDQQKHELAYQKFCEMQGILSLGEWMVVQRKTSDEGEIPSGIGLLIIDGNHGPQAIKDVERWAPHVSHGGIVYLDDINWSGGAVARAGKMLMEDGFVPLYKRDQGIFYQRTR